MTKKQEGIVNFFIGEVLKKCRNADPRLVREIVIRLLEGER